MSLKLLLLFCLLVLNSARALPAKNNRIIGGENAQKGEFPHLVSVQWGKVVPYLNPLCGGSILNEYWILTAGHCFEKKYGHDFYVRAGKYSIMAMEKFEQIVKVDSVFVHEKFNLSEISNDIALLKLKTPLEFNEIVQPIGLTDADAQVDDEVVLAGWGLTSNGQEEDPDILQKVTMFVMGYQNCKEAAEQFYDTPPFYETEMCTGPTTGGVAACDGDSGSPLLKIKEDGRPEVVGITSWTFKPCGIIGSPTVFTKISSYISWIESIIKNN